MPLERAFKAVSRENVKAMRLGSSLWEWCLEVGSAFGVLVNTIATSGAT